MSSETLMEKPTSGRCRCRTQSWYIVFISCLLWFTMYMVYLYSTSVTFSKREYSLAVGNDTDVLDSSESFLVRDDETGDSSGGGDVNVVDNVEDENDTDSKTEEKPDEELSEDEEVYRAIKSLLVEDQNENGTDENEINSGKRKENRVTEEKQGKENVAELKREGDAEDREKRNKGQIAKRRETANHLEKLRGEYVEDRAAEGNGTANVAELKREDNADVQEKRNEEQAVSQKEAANHLEKLRGEYVEDRAAKGKGTANVAELKREDNAEYQEKRNEEQADSQKDAGNHLDKLRGQYVEDREAKGKGTANAEDQGKREDTAEDQEKRKEDRATKQKETADHLEQLRGEYVEDRAAKGKGTAIAEDQGKRENTVNDQEKRKEDRATKQKETADHLEQLRGEYIKDRAANRKGTANVLEQQREDNADDQGKRDEAKRKRTANVSGQHKVNGTEQQPAEKLLIVKSQIERTRQSRRETRNKPVDSSDPVKEKRNEKAVVEPRRARARSDPCSGRYIYIHNLPRKFNQDLLDTCRSLSFWTDMCECASNLGLGAPLPADDKLYSRTGWFNTNQFLLEVIFHNRMKQYRCLTKDPSIASAIYVPYYAGLDVGRYLWDTDGFMRDYDAVNIVKWLASRPEWKRMWGRDHFLVAGRINWDFRRNPKNESDWGNELLNIDEARNMTTLVLESSPWNYNDFAIPYPTYFHPSRDSEVFQWQNRMRRLKRRFLFSFAGARRPQRHESIRNELIDQCLATRRRCRFLECDKTRKCHKPAYVLKLFQSSIFCLQPSGDSYTRRSIFDSIVAGCIPVFFHPGSAYVQYIWHFPKDYTKYSVFIPESDVKSGKANIERILQRIPRERRAAMRDEVINMIPSVIYADPSSRLRQTEDAFDRTVKGVLDRIERVRNQMKEGEIVNHEFDEEESWKYFACEKLGPHEWDVYFSRKIGKHAL